MSDIFADLDAPGRTEFRGTGKHRLTDGRVVSPGDVVDFRTDPPTITPKERTRRHVAVPLVWAHWREWVWSIEPMPHCTVSSASDSPALTLADVQKTLAEWAEQRSEIPEPPDFPIYVPSETFKVSLSPAVHGAFSKEMPLYIGGEPHEMPLPGPSTKTIDFTAAASVVGLDDDDNEIAVDGPIVVLAELPARVVRLRWTSKAVQR